MIYKAVKEIWHENPLQDKQLCFELIINLMLLVYSESVY